MQKTSCLECKHFEFDENSYGCLLKYELLLSLEIPDECDQFEDDTL